MRQISLAKEYEDYLQYKLKNENYTSIEDIIQEALNEQMKNDDQFMNQRLLELIKEGEDDIAAGRVVEYDENFWENINNKVKENIVNNKPIPDHVRP